MNHETPSPPVVLLRVKRKRNHSPKPIIALHKLTDLSLHPDSFSRDIKRQRSEYGAGDDNRIVSAIQDLSMDQHASQPKPHSSGFIQQRDREQHKAEVHHAQSFTSPNEMLDPTSIPTLTSGAFFKRLVTTNTINDTNDIQQWYHDLQQGAGNESIDILNRSTRPSIAVFNALHEKTLLQGNTPSHHRTPSKASPESESISHTDHNPPTAQDSQANHGSPSPTSVLDAIYGKRISLEPINDTHGNMSLKSNQSHHSSSFNPSKPPPPRRRGRRAGQPHGLALTASTSPTGNNRHQLHSPISMLDRDTLAYIEARKERDRAGGVESALHGGSDGTAGDADGDAEPDDDSVYDIYQLCGDDYSHILHDSSSVDYVISTQELQYMVQEMVMDMAEPMVSVEGMERAEAIRDALGGYLKYVNESTLSDSDSDQLFEPDLDAREVDYPSSEDESEDDDHDYPGDDHDMRMQLSTRSSTRRLFKYGSQRRMPIPRHNLADDDDDDNDDSDDIIECDDEEYQDYVHNKHVLYRDHLQRSIISRIQAGIDPKKGAQSVWWLGSEDSTMAPPSHLPKQQPQPQHTSSSDSDTESDEMVNTNQLSDEYDFNDPCYDPVVDQYGGDDEDDMYGGSNPFFMFAKGRSS